ncbi:hypothetical protein EVA_12367 [gut metagenome]|uniref:Uncharacterized protein n=1 Tax=gut metagenome TaxID=749906 RepID=J9FX19_9ZZZZ
MLSGLSSLLMYPMGGLCHCISGFTTFGKGISGRLTMGRYFSNFIDFMTDDVFLRVS